MNESCFKTKAQLLVLFSTYCGQQDLFVGFIFCFTSFVVSWQIEFND